MATVSTNPRPDSAPARGDQLVSWFGIGWEGYRSLLKVQGEKARPQITYLDGDAYLLSTSFPHEWLSIRLHHFVLEVAVGLDIPFVMAGETTLSRRKKRAGVQPDESYFFANWETIAAKDPKADLDLRVDPPPDLSIKVSDRQNPTVALEALRRLGIPEVWVCDREKLRIFLRGPEGRYAESGAGLVFPFLKAVEIHDWAIRPGMDSTTQWMRELRQWVQEVLVSRVRG